jgi:hypothetical protein
LVWITVDDLVESNEGKVAPLFDREIRQFQALRIQRILVGEGRRASDVTIFKETVEISPVPDKAICHWVRFSIGFVITVVWIYTVHISIACGTLPQVSRVQIRGDVWFVAYVLNYLVRSGYTYYRLESPKKEILVDVFIFSLYLKSSISDRLSPEIYSYPQNSS